MARPDRLSRFAPLGTVFALVACFSCLSPAIALGRQGGDAEGQPSSAERRRLGVTVDANVMYGGYFRIAGSGHGPAYGGSLSLLWRESENLGLGCRLSGWYSPAHQAESTDFVMSGITSHGQHEAAAIDLAFLADLAPHPFLHGWVALGLGVNSHPHGGTQPFSTLDVLTLPEAYAAIGYKLPLVWGLSLDLSAEAATSLILYRGMVQAGLSWTF